MAVLLLPRALPRLRVLRLLPRRRPLRLSKADQFETWGGAGNRASFFIWRVPPPSLPLIWGGIRLVVAADRASYPICSSPYQGEVRCGYSDLQLSLYRLPIPTAKAC